MKKLNRLNRSFEKFQPNMNKVSIARSLRLEFKLASPGFKGPISGLTEILLSLHIAAIHEQKVWDKPPILFQSSGVRYQSE